MIEINKNFIDYILLNYGIDISKYDETFLFKSIQKRKTETNCNSVQDYCTFLEQNDNESKYFFDSLHISYSEFFRNSLTFAVLEKIVFPGIALNKKNSRHKEIRVWSAACASGQESYSLAMLLEELKNGTGEQFNYRIFATDQDKSQINEAQKAQYSESAIVNINLKRIKQWFTQQGAIYTINQELKNHIIFSIFDLFNENYSSPPESIFGDFDIVFCANLLFYYKKEYRKMIIDKMKNSLTNGGILIVGETEREILMNYNFRELYPQSAIFRV
jgi:chemotaxis methyl-accepting protein methylase